MSSARPVPMWCTSRSENRFAVWLLSAALGERPVESDGVWHKAQPTASEVNSARPWLTEVEQAGSGAVPQEGVGGARNRMKFANPITSAVRSWGDPGGQLGMASGVG